MKNIAIITVDFNSHKETHACLYSLSKLKKDNLSVMTIVVDNASKEKLVLTKEEEKNGAILLRTKENLGFTGGNNVGIRYGLEKNVDYVMLINNDTEVDKNLLTQLIDTFEKNPDCGIVSPKIYFAKGHEYHTDAYAEKEKGNVLWYAGGFVDWQNVFNVHRGVDEVDHGQYDKEEKITFATGCCLLTSSDILRKVGLFDDRYFLYFEDGDISQRVQRAGYAIVYQPKAYLWHITAASGGGSGSVLHDYFLTRNRLLFAVLYAPARAKFALLRESMRLLLFGRKWQKKGVRDFYMRKFGRGSFGI